MTEQPTSEQLLTRCVELAQEKKAQQMVSLSLTGLTLIADYFLIMTATSSRQAQSLSDAIEAGLKELGQPPLRIEGYHEARWILLDLGGVFVHIFQQQEREYFDLERLWGDAEQTRYE